MLLYIMQENFSSYRFTVVYCNPTIIMNQLEDWVVVPVCGMEATDFICIRLCKYNQMKNAYTIQINHTNS